MDKPNGQYNGTITVDRLNHSVIAVRKLSKYNGLRHTRKRWYNRKTPRGAKVVKTMINFLYETKKEKEYLYFITITTVQHRSGKTDKELFGRVGVWLKNRQLHYVCTVERQRDTEDLHFHIIIRASSKFDIRYELGRLSKLLSVQNHPALFDVKRIDNLQRVVGYINKYITKNGTKYSSVFRCRTFSVAKRTRASYKAMAHRFVCRIEPGECVDFILNVKYPLKYQHNTDFFVSYKYAPYIWLAARATKEKRNTCYSTQKNILVK